MSWSVFYFSYNTAVCRLLWFIYLCLMNVFETTKPSVLNPVLKVTAFQTAGTGDSVQLFQIPVHVSFYLKKKVKYHINIYYRNDNMLYLPVTCPVASSTSSGVLLSVFKKMPNVLVVLCSTLRAHWDCSQVIQLSSLTDSTLTWTCRTSSGERSLPSILCIIS